MAGTGTKRIIELTEASTIQSGDFIAVDSSARGTKKVPTDTLATSAALTAETNARAGADEQMSERMDGIEEQTALIQNPTKTLSGALAHFTDGADMPMVACTASIVPKQSGTGTPSPDNVRPISGWESVKTGVRNKNLLTTTNTETVSGVTYTPQSDGSIKAVGTSTGTYPKYIWTDGKQLPAGNYMMSAGDEVTENGVRLSCAIKRVGGNTQYYECTSSAEKPFTVYADDISMSIYMRTNGGSTAINATVYPMIRLASDTDPTYEPYTGTTTTVNLGRTVYGGTLDVVSGVLTVDRVYKTINDLDWTYNSANAVFWTNIAEMARPCTLYSSHYGQSEVSAIADIPNYSIWNKSYAFTPKNLLIKDTRFTDASSFKQNMSGVAISYELSTPQTYQLTPTEVSTLLGENNVWADAGDVEITYRRDISIVLENLENALNGSNSLNTMMMSAPTENTAEEPTEDEAEDDMR